MQDICIHIPTIKVLTLTITTGGKVKVGFTREKSKSNSIVILIILPWKFYYKLQIKKKESLNKSHLSFQFPILNFTFINKEKDPCRLKPFLGEKFKV
jgi:hypothetical protein